MCDHSSSRDRYSKDNNAQTTYHRSNQSNKHVQKKYHKYSHDIHKDKLVVNDASEPLHLMYRFCFVEYKRVQTCGRRVPYLTWQMSPTSRSLTGTCSTSPPRIVANLCSCSILFCSPRNWRSFRQSLNAVTRTTTTTATRIAIPSIHSAFDSDSSCSISAPQSDEQFIEIHSSEGERFLRRAVHNDDDDDAERRRPQCPAS